MPIINREHIIYLLIKQTGYIGHVNEKTISATEKELAETIYSLLETAEDDIEYEDRLALEDDELFREYIQPQVKDLSEFDDPTEYEPEPSQKKKLKY